MLPIAALFGIGEKLLDRIFPDPEARASAQLELLKMQQTGELAQLAADTDLAKGQLEVNKVEAAHASIFVAGWRPFIGWVCGVAMAYHFVFIDLLNWLVAVSGGKVPDLPQLNTSELSNILMAMLGIGAMRTVEKVKGVANNAAPVTKLPWQK